MAMSLAQSDAFHAMVQTAAMQMRRLEQTLQQITNIYVSAGIATDTGFVDHSTNPAETKAAALLVAGTITQYMNMLGNLPVTQGDHRGNLFKYTRDIFP